MWRLIKMQPPETAEKYQDVDCRLSEQNRLAILGELETVDGWRNRHRREA